eukprot:jgi/Chlat1/2154/Chrsp17S02731
MARRGEQLGAPDAWLRGAAEGLARAVAGAGSLLDEGRRAAVSAVDGFRLRAAQVAPWTERSASINNNKSGASTSGRSIRSSSVQGPPSSSSSSSRRSSSASLQPSSLFSSPRFAAVSVAENPALPSPSAIATDLDLGPPIAQIKPSDALLGLDAPTKEELGRSTWTLLHTLAAQFPERPTKQQQRDAKELITVLSRIYPCGDCARHFQQILKNDPPVVSSGFELAQWLCRVHNVVNRSLNKPQFNCQRVDARWRALDCDESACDLDIARLPARKYR